MILPWIFLFSLFEVSGWNKCVKCDMKLVFDWMCHFFPVRVKINTNKRCLHCVISIRIALKSKVTFPERASWNYFTIEKDNNRVASLFYHFGRFYTQKAHITRREAMLKQYHFNSTSSSCSSSVILWHRAICASQVN